MRAALLTVLLLVAASARAVVLHDDLMPADRPVDLVTGRWGTTASCVVVGPDLIMTTTHQGSATAVTIDGTVYTVAETINSGDDLRFARLTRDGRAADLTDWVGLHYGDVVGMDFVVGGYGRSRGAELTSSHGVYGYQWLDEPNATLRWGGNTVDSTLSGKLVADFDGPSAAGATAFEAAIAEFDSGSGWFVKIDGQWAVAGLSSGVEHFGTSLFASSTGRPDADRFQAVQLGLHADWIDQTLAELMPVAGDTDRDGDVDADDLAAFARHYGAAAGVGWTGGNFDGDGDVDLVDLGLMSLWYGYGTGGGAGAMDFQADLRTALVPEPMTAALLLAACPLLVRRKR